MSPFSTQPDAGADDCNPSSQNCSPHPGKKATTKQIFLSDGRGFWGAAALFVTLTGRFSSETSVERKHSSHLKSQGLPEALMPALVASTNKVKSSCRPSLTARSHLLKTLRCFCHVHKPVLLSGMGKIVCRPGPRPARCAPDSTAPASVLVAAGW